VEYIYDQEIKTDTPEQENPSKLSSEKWEVSTEKKVRSYNEQEFLSHISMPNLETKNNFHVFFLGLDRNNLTTKELYQEINIKLKMLVGEVPHENIMIIDPSSIESSFPPLKKT
jgi:hypothetical protein